MQLLNTSHSEAQCCQDCCQQFLRDPTTSFAPGCILGIRELSLPSLLNSINITCEDLFLLCLSYAHIIMLICSYHHAHKTVTKEIPAACALQAARIQNPRVSAVFTNFLHPWAENKAG